MIRFANGLAIHCATTQRDNRDKERFVLGLCGLAPLVQQVESYSRSKCSKYRFADYLAPFTRHATGGLHALNAPERDNRDKRRTHLDLCLGVGTSLRGDLASLPGICVARRAEALPGPVVSDLRRAPRRAAAVATGSA